MSKNYLFFHIRNVLFAPFILFILLHGYVTHGSRKDTIKQAHTVASLGLVPLQKQGKLMLLYPDVIT